VTTVVALASPLLSRPGAVAGEGVDAGVAAHCAGATADARAWLAQALHLNPNFSVRWASVAKRMLAEVTS